VIARLREISDLYLFRRAGNAPGPGRVIKALTLCLSSPFLTYLSHHPLRVKLLCLPSRHCGTASAPPALGNICPTLLLLDFKSFLPLVLSVPYLRPFSSVTPLPSSLALLFPSFSFHSHPNLSVLVVFNMHISGLPVSCLPVHVCGLRGGVFGQHPCCTTFCFPSHHTHIVSAKRSAIGECRCSFSYD
jgi:hypothetical protein